MFRPPERPCASLVHGPWPLDKSEYTSHYSQILNIPKVVRMGSQKLLCTTSSAQGPPETHSTIQSSSIW